MAGWSRDQTQFRLPLRSTEDQDLVFHKAEGRVFDPHGVLRYIGMAGGTQPYANSGKKEGGVVASMWGGSYFGHPKMFVEHVTMVGSCETTPNASPTHR